MRKNIPFLIILLLLYFVSLTTLTAKEISGTLSKGEGSSFVPIQGSSFSVVSDVTKGIYDGNYNVLIKSNYRVFYEEKNQIDDLYLIFNEPVKNGDMIEVEVNKGVFLFKMNRLDQLPEAVKDALKEQVPQQYKKMEALQEPQKIPVIKEKVIAPSKPAIVSKPIVTEPIVAPTPKVLQAGEIPTIKPEATSFKDDEKVGFFDALSQKINALFGLNKLDISQEEVMQSTPPSISHASIIKDEVDKPKTMQSGLSDLPKEIPNVSVAKTKDSEITPPNISSRIEEIAKLNKIEAPKTSASGIKLPEVLPVPIPIFDVNKGMSVSKNEFLSQDEKIEPFEKSSFPKTTDIQTGKFQTKISTDPLDVPKFQDNSGEFGIKEIKINDKPPVFKNEVIKTPEIVEVISVETAPKVIVAHKPVVHEGETKDKIVITKTITPKEEPRVIKRHVEPREYKSTQSQTATDRMSDRVLGGGYGDESKAKLRVKAYSNKKEVSAWVEVFKVGTNQRVKTFYTGKGKSLKDIKLPAGVYVVKATYRTASSKQQKILGKVRLTSGKRINRNISFDEGSIIVSVKKSNKPFYAKVEVFKSGSNRRIAYEFTSKKTGEAQLNLAAGEYNIVVRDYANKREFKNIFIQSSENKIINVKF